VQVKCCPLQVKYCITLMAVAYTYGKKTFPPVDLQADVCLMRAILVFFGKKNEKKPARA
jgi:hypothetical protein